MIQMEIGGVGFRLDPAAISAVRYRAEYGESIVNDLANCKTALETEGRLLRMCRLMVPAADRPELLDFAKLAHRDPKFLEKAISARDALLDSDPLWSGGEESGAPFDEYQVLALMAAAHMDTGLIYELPIMHLVAIAARYFDAQDPDKVSYHKMDADEMARMYPR